VGGRARRTCRRAAKKGGARDALSRNYERERKLKFFLIWGKDNLKTKLGWTRIGGEGEPANPNQGGMETRPSGPQDGIGHQSRAAIGGTGGTGNQDPGESREKRGPV